MEDAPVTAATGALGPVVTKLRALVRRCRGEYKLRRRTRKDVKLIKSKLKSVHSILWVIWEREDVDAEGKELRMEAWRLADDMNDAIDDFILSLKRSNNGRRFIQAKDQPSRPFQDLKRRAVDVCARCRNKWKKMETAQTTIVSSLFSRTKAAVDDSGLAKRRRVIDPYVHKDVSELLWMDRKRDELMGHLVGEQETTPKLKMASILGPAGVGKTTLSRLVYDAIDQDKFQARAFVSVTSSNNMTEVLASIYQQVQGLAHSTVVPLAGTKAATAEKHLIDEISNFLKDKRYLVIIDDIWYCEEWETIKKSLPDNNLRSIIVTTSRAISITEKWHEDLDAFIYKLNYFRDNIGALFTEKIVDMSVDIVGQGFEKWHGIVDMCGGMPLAVACMISALAKERERQEEQEGLCVLNTPDLQGRIEQQVRKNGIQKTPGFEALVESLELGYKDLPHHMLKTCLLYCSIYPEDHILSRDDVVRRWMVEGFVCKEEAAKDYFDELVSRGLFQEFGCFNFYKLHPLMRNYLRWKLRKDNFVTCTSDGVPCSPVGRLCIDYWPNGDALDTFSGIDWHHIRSLVVFKDAERVPYKHLENLRVLDVRYNPDLENQHLKDVCGLFRLRHLLLSGGASGTAINVVPTGMQKLTEIPEEIAKLQYLETLELTLTNITRLPAEIGDLKQLKTLDVCPKQELAELPREIGNLQHLETLHIHRSNIRDQAWEIIGTLKKLKTLDVSCNRLSGIPRGIGQLQQLKTLNLAGTGLTDLPREIGDLQRLEYLNLCGTPITEVPRDIGKLQHLKYLDLRHTKVRKMPREIWGLQNLKYLNDQVGILPLETALLSKLEGLPNCVCRAWRNSQLVSSLAGEILSFDTRDSIDNGGLIVGTKRMHIPQWIKEHFNDIGFLDIRVCKLEEHDLKILRDMPNLGELILRFEAVLRKPIVISSGGFAELWHLTVDSRVPRITFQEGAMPSLQRLEFEFQFYPGPPNTDPPMGIKHLENLGTVVFQCNEWYRAGSPCISATIDAVRKEGMENFNALILEVSGQDDIFLGHRYAQSSEDGSEAWSSCEDNDNEIEETFPANHIAQSSEDGSDACTSSRTEEIEEIFPENHIAQSTEDLQ